jgi:hypothetical protein
MNGLRKPLDWIQRPLLTIIAILCLAALVLIAGCDFGWGPPRDISRFNSASLVGTGDRGVFTAEHIVYRPASGWRAFPDGGPAKYIVDVRIIGVYELNTGKVCTLQTLTDPDKQWFPGSWHATVDRVKNGLVLIGLSGQRQSDYGYDNRLYWLDLATGSLDELNLRQELAEKGFALKRYWLADDAGSLVITSLPRGQKPSRALEPPVHLWLRRPGGTYVDGGEIIHYYGYDAGCLHVYTPNNRYMILDTVSGARREGLYSEYLAILDQMKARDQRTAGRSLSAEGKILVLRTERGGKQRSQILPVKLEELIPKSDQEWNGFDLR